MNFDWFKELNEITIKQWQAMPFVVRYATQQLFWSTINNMYERGLIKDGDKYSELYFISLECSKQCDINRPDFEQLYKVQ